MLTLYVGKGPYYPEGRTQRVIPPFLQQSFKGMDNFNPSTSNNPRFEPPRTKIQCFKCKKMGHGIDFCKVHLAEEKASNMQSNIATKHNQLYATTLIIVDGSDNT